MSVWCQSGVSLVFPLLILATVSGGGFAPASDLPEAPTQRVDLPMLVGPKGARWAKLGVSLVSVWCQSGVSLVSVCCQYVVSLVFPL